MCARVGRWVQGNVLSEGRTDTSRQRSVVLIDPVFEEPDVLFIRAIVNRERRIERYSTPSRRDDQIVRAFVSSGTQSRRRIHLVTVMTHAA